MAEHRPLSASLGFAWDGLAEGAVRDRNLRIHLGLGALVGAFVARTPLAAMERALLVLCVAIVIAAEAANSALEAAVDLASPGLDERARIAKDSAAGAVLAVAAGSVVVFLAVAGGRAAELAAWGGTLAPGAALRLVAAALAAALGASLLPSPAPRPGAADLLLLAGGAAGVAVLAGSFEGCAGVATAALCLAVGAGGAARRRRGPRPAVHSS